MASKTVIKLGATEEYYGSLFKNALARAENCLESGHLKSFTFDRETNNVLASVLASKKDICYNVTVNFTRTKILTSSCQCTRALAVCSHLCAVLLYLHRNVSVTDAACSWSVRKKRTKNNEQLIPCNDFRAIQETPLSEELTNYLYHGVENCQGAALSVKWLTSPEPARQEEIPPQLVNPCDVIFSEDFKQAVCKKSFLSEKLFVEWETIERVAEATKQQATSPLWIELRKLRITASKVGDILKIYSRDEHRQKPSQSLLKSLYKPANLNKVMATMWGREHESIAIKQFTKEYGTEVCKTGLWLDECGYLGGSPDGLIGEQGICEVKCPYSLRDSKLQDVLKPGCDFFCIMKMASGISIQIISITTKFKL